MSSQIMNNNLIDGIVSRYVKPSFIKNNIISNDLFDLRDMTPPEEFVSFYKVDDIDEDIRFTTAKSCLRMSISQNGAIVLLDIDEVLDEINDEEIDIISFTEQNLPHCGLNYITSSLTKIQEAKTTLSYLASQRFKFIKDIKKLELKINDEKI